MSVQIDDEYFHQILPGATTLAVSDVEVIGQLAYLTANIDLDEDIDEDWLLAALNRALWHLAGRPPEPIVPISPLPLPVDHDARVRWIRELVPQLTTPEARELAYVTAYLTIVVDLELAPIESELLQELQIALELDDARANELSGAAAWALTERA